MELCNKSRILVRPPDLHSIDFTRKGFYSSVQPQSKTAPLVMLILQPYIVDTCCPKAPPAESTLATIGNFIRLYSFEKSCNKWPKHNLCEFMSSLWSYPTFLIMEPAFLVPPEEFFGFPWCHAKDGAHGYWKLQHRLSSQCASVSE